MQKWENRTKEFLGDATKKLTPYLPQRQSATTKIGLYASIYINPATGKFLSLSVLGLPNSPSFGPANLLKFL